jgi:galactokinase
MRALREAGALKLTDIRMAVLARRAENEFVGAPVGIMDQMACTFADEQAALFLDTRSLEYRRVPIPEPVELMVISSGVVHDHAAGDYRTRRAECEEAARLLGVRELRDCGPNDLPRARCLPDPLARRAKHVITENVRVHQTVDAFDRSDLTRAGTLFRESHASMRDDFAVSILEVDRLVAIADEQPEVYGARLTGGGFGGSIVALVRRGSARRVSSLVAERYREAVGRTASVLVPVVT